MSTDDFEAAKGWAAPWLPAMVNLFYQKSGEPVLKGSGAGLA